MKIEIVIFVLFFAVARSSGSYEILSSSQSNIDDDFVTIGSGDTRTIRQYQEIYNFFFDVIAGLAKVSLRLQKKLKPELPEREVIENALFHAFSTAISATIYVVHLIQVDPLQDQTTWPLVRNDTKGYVVNILSAISLCMKSSASLPQIERIENEATNKAVESITIIYNATAAGRAEGAAVTNASESGKTKAISDYRVMFRATFSAIRILYEINSSKVKVESKRVLASIEYLRNLVLDTQKSEAGGRSDLFYSIYASDLLGEPKLASQFSELLSIEKRLTDDWRDIIDTTWDAIHKIEKTKYVAPIIEAARKKILVSLKDAFVTTAGAFGIIRVNNSYKIEDDERVDGWSNDVPNAIADSLKIIKYPESSGNLEKIDANQKKLNLALSSLISLIFDVTAHISIVQPDVTAAIERVRKLAIRYMLTGFGVVFDEFRLIIARKSFDTCLFFGLETKNVAFSYVKRECQVKFGLFRKLFILNSLFNHGINLKYSIVDMYWSES